MKSICRLGVYVEYVKYVHKVIVLHILYIYYINFYIYEYIYIYIKQGRSQDFGSGGKHQTKFSVRSPKFRFGAVTFSKNLLNKKF